MTDERGLGSRTPVGFAVRGLSRRRFLGGSAVASLAALTRPGEAATVVNAAERGRAERSEEPKPVTLFLCGDVMTGRGIDQVLPYPNDPHLCEPFVRSAVEYVRLAEAAHGPIPRPMDFAYVWGDALGELARADARIVNLETSVTTSADCAPKGINYRMHPKNAPCLAAAGIDCCVLANNHVLDWGRPGLLETLETLADVPIKGAGAGRDAEAAAAPAALEIAGKGRVLVFAFGAMTSGIPRAWAAGADRPGVNVLPDLSERTASRVADGVRRARRPGDVVVASIHWGENWGYRVPRDQIAFAHWLIGEAGVDVVHGHSSHHPKAIEVHAGKPILYGCGDFLNDYEGIGGYEEFRGDLALMYFLAIRPGDGRLRRLWMIPLRIQRFRLERAPRADAAWLADVLSREGKGFGTRVELEADDALTLAWD